MSADLGSIELLLELSSSSARRGELKEKLKQRRAQTGEAESPVSFTTTPTETPQDVRSTTSCAVLKKIEVAGRQDSLRVAFFLGMCVSVKYASMTR